MPEGQDAGDKGGGLYTKATGLIPLFVVYMFLPGAVYLSFYYRSFGVSTRWLDIAASEVLMRAFTLMLNFKTLFAVVFGLLLLGPVLVELTTTLRQSVAINTALVLVYIVSPLYLYVESQNSALNDAKRDKGRQTTLPFVTYLIKNCQTRAPGERPPLAQRSTASQSSPQQAPDSCLRHGRLLLIRDRTLFVVGDATADAEDVREIHILPTESIENVTIARSSQ